MYKRQIIGCSILIIGMAIFFPKTSAFTESYAKEENIEGASEYELNRHRLNMQSIISENSGMDRVKEQVTEERDVDFETTYQNNGSLPKGEEAVSYTHLDVYKRQLYYYTIFFCFWIGV